jgi:hypothetical protein
MDRLTAPRTSWSSHDRIVILNLGVFSHDAIVASRAHMIEDYNTSNQGQCRMHMVVKEQVSWNSGPSIRDACAYAQITKDTL